MANSDILQKRLIKAELLSSKVLLGCIFARQIPLSGKERSISSSKERYFFYKFSLLLSGRRP